MALSLQLGSSLTSLGGSCDDPGNFQPISVVPITAQLLEKLITIQLSDHLEVHGLLHDHQGTYHCVCSADQILLFVTDTVTCTLDRGSTVCAAFLDLRKAFDSLDHTILLDCLHKLGVSGTELLWFRHYLAD